MIQLFISWLIISMIVFATGDLFLLVYKRLTKLQDATSLTDTFFLGICTVSALVTLLSLFLPISVGILALFFVLSILYFILRRKLLLSRIQLTFFQIKNMAISLKIALTLLFISVVLYGLTTPLLYDEGLYHLQTMQWIENFHVVRGLGNLHGRFAFNSSFLMISTLFNYHSQYYTVFFSINSLCLFVFGTWVISRISHIEHLTQKLIFVFLLLLSVFLFATNLSSTSTDILPNILVMYILLSMFGSNKIDVSKLVILSVMAVSCITFKLSSIPILLVCAYAVFMLVRQKEFRLLSIFIIVGLLIGIPWITRFVLLSGYLIYPLPSIDLFGFDWKMPVEDLIAEKNAAYAWPRIPGANSEEVLKMPYSEWLPIWLSNQSVFTLILYLLAVFSPILVIFRLKIVRQNKMNLLAWAIAFAGFLMGFFTAPDLRFSIGFILCAGFVPVMFFRLPDNVSNLQRVVPSFLLLLGFVWLTISAFRQVKHYQPKSESLFLLVFKPQSIDIKKTEANPSFGEFEINKTTLYYPLNGNQCFDVCLPCMPYKNTRIEMRGETLQEGFRKRPGL